MNRVTPFEFVTTAFAVTGTPSISRTVARIPPLFLCPLCVLRRSRSRLDRLESRRVCLRCRIRRFPTLSMFLTAPKSSNERQ
jgi:hypothetical protein